MEVQYKFYGTLLDAFSYYLKSDSDEAFQEFINKLNRVPFESEPARKGTALNDLVDERAAGTVNHYLDIDGYYHFRGFKFSAKVIDYLVGYYTGAIAQLFTQGVLDTRKGKVLLYGYIDELLPGEVHDIKGTGSYAYPKFLNYWQKLVYPFCLAKEGVDCPDFTYMITDYEQIYREDYRFRPERDIPKLANICEELIDFIENHRLLITDKKLFALEDPSGPKKQTPSLSI